MNIAGVKIHHWKELNWQNSKVTKNVLKRFAIEVKNNRFKVVQSQFTIKSQKTTDSLDQMGSNSKTFDVI